MELSENEFLYISSRTPLVNVDLLVMNEKGEILLSWRDDEYCGIGWHIPGGVIRHGETMLESVKQTAFREFGFIPEIESDPCRITEIFLKQQYRNHSISCLFRCQCRRSDIQTVSEGDASHQGDLCWFDSYPNHGLVYSQQPYEMYLKSIFARGNVYES